MKVSSLLQPYLNAPLPDGVEEKLAQYLELILKWNARTNLTAVRDAEGIVRRHFGESLFLGGLLPEFSTLLDFGSGAGFPGIPVQLIRPLSKVTLAESQGKKASFLREAVRSLAIPSDVWAARVETMPESKTFDVVAMRAVDGMAAAIAVAVSKVRPGGQLALMLGREKMDLPEDFNWADPVAVPGDGGLILLGSRN
ncbi:16S rRNA (guanine(527)-N(7))-methyltransferase RsmG [Terriglobus saanensis]|uniref:Ribosomal RNA small subunit methyltransferase G n=1 Tax=Terriglobus saanensis (strain ATCC BAA-1853 / DSM 23119 / SP1PR4) TaxID=401053 RepID=E8V5E0_TERSS|nr:16S rRNA (guanine(527)-N(7))-methyltransferase RsmG [Terriglobus saanensis]ADV84899.1 methyltransferase GidB [Terriglobus saanensis SP1PR4]